MKTFEYIYRLSKLQENRKKLFGYKLKESGGYVGKNHYDSIRDVIGDYKKGWISRFVAYDIAEQFGWDLDSNPIWVELMNEGMDDNDIEQDIVYCSQCGRKFDWNTKGSLGPGNCKLCDNCYENLEGSW